MRDCRDPVSSVRYKNNQCVAIDISNGNWVTSLGIVHQENIEAYRPTILVLDFNCPSKPLFSAHGTDFKMPVNDATNGDFLGVILERSGINQAPSL
jgi:hypothetical protein